MRLGRFLRANRRRAPRLILQSEAAECGISCLAMVAGSHGYEIDLGSLRRRFSPSAKGSRLPELMDIAEHLQLSARAVKLNLAALDLLVTPAILHWDFNHFVVLARVEADRVEILDPARGRYWLSMAEASEHFTGIALELRPLARFAPQSAVRTVRFRELLGKMPSMGKHVLQVVGLSVALEMLGVLTPLFVQWVVDHAIVTRDKALVVQLGQAFFLLLLAQVLMSASRSWLMTYLGTHVNLRLGGNLFHHLMRLPIEFFERRHLGDIVSRFDSLNTIQRTLTSGFLAAILDGAMTVITLSMMFYTNARLSLIVVGAALVYVALRVALYRTYRAASQEQIVCAARQQSHFLESVRGIQSVKLFGQEQAREESWLNHAVATSNAGLRTQRATLFYQMANTLLFGAENILVVVVGAQAVIDADFSVGMLFAFIAYKLQFVARLGSLVEKVADYAMLSLHRERVGDIALSPAERVDGGTRAPATPWAPTIELVNVAYRYSPAEPPVFSGVNLRIEAGEFVAITGPSGCGKTTLVKVMLGLLQPDQGEVLIDGIPLRELGLKTWRAAIGSVMQEDKLFAGSIADNIHFFSDGADHAEVVRAARMADIHDDIERMPMGYETLIGDMGGLVSGGQRQRILIARALYRRPRLLFLDEATSHLDGQRERAVNAAIQAMSLTRIVVAHRAETIRMAAREIRFPL